MEEGDFHEERTERKTTDLAHRPRRSAKKKTQRKPRTKKPKRADR